jgi:2-polyprenyl-6-methoxyphenol hydroxylase-like FAD-dependent oxidoreductase
VAELADELSRADENNIKLAINLYEKLRRDPVDKIQADSRRMFKNVMLESNFLRKLRNILVKRISAERFLGRFFNIASKPYKVS